jgi:hypothetical protein
MTIRSLLLTLLVSAAGRPAPGQTPPAAPQVNTVTRTAYSRNTELFAEWSPLIVGQTTRRTAHLTRTGDRALRGGQSDADVDRRIRRRGSS